MSEECGAGSKRVKNVELVLRVKNVEMALRVKNAELVLREWRMWSWF